MKNKKYKRVMISMPEEMWQNFKSQCHEHFKSASSVIRELIIDWSKENGEKEHPRKKT